MRQSAEDYIETILVLSQSGQPVHAVDIARELDFTRASVSVAMKNLLEQGLIAYEEDFAITLTDAGRAIAEKVYDRHTVLTSWLVSIGVPAHIADADACVIEHVISEETFDAIKRLEK
ncbi:MAG: metal-dependent transcriptional regulator [Oscillospiraceae bacterium]|jgi:Mn-dependent DtxR family transcriptional regulator|nr:metal-dependent transcriptional regulator [Oscillospiraceae bacterium]